MDNNYEYSSKVIKTQQLKNFDEVDSVCIEGVKSEGGTQIKDTNIYDYLIKFKERNNALQIRLNDLSKLKVEISIRDSKIKELEYSLAGCKNEIQRLVNKNEENMKLNEFWESTFREIKYKLNILEEEKIKYKDEADEFRSRYEDLVFKNEILEKKIVSNEENITLLKNVKLDYEKSNIEMKKEYKHKEEILNTKLLSIENEYQKRLKELESEFFSKKEEMVESLRKLEREKSEDQNILSELNDYIQELEMEMKTKESNHDQLIDEKNITIKKLENELKKVSTQTNDQVINLKKELDSIQEDLDSNQNLYTEKIAELERLLSIESEGKSQFEHFIRNEENSKHVKVVKKYEKEIYSLKRLLEEKGIEIERIQTDFSRTLDSLEYSETNNKENNRLKKIIRQKEEECSRLILQNSEIEKKLRKVIKDNEEIKQNYDNIIQQYKSELVKKNEEINLLKKNYEKYTLDFQNKLDRVFK
jgi:hypothetical protein